MIRPDRRPAGSHRVENLIERHDDVLEFAEEKLEREISARHFARHRDQAAAQPVAHLVRRAADGRALVGRHQHRPVAVAHARAAGQQRVAIAHVGVGVDRDRRDVQLAAQGALVQRLDVLEPMLEAIAAQIDLVFRHRVKHEGVIGIGRMAQGENAWAAGRHGGDAKRWHCEGAIEAGFGRFAIK